MKVGGNLGLCLLQLVGPGDRAQAQGEGMGTPGLSRNTCARRSHLLKNHRRELPAAHEPLCSHPQVYVPQVKGPAPCGLLAPVGISRLIRTFQYMVICVAWSRQGGAANCVGWGWRWGMAWEGFREEVEPKQGFEG